VIQRTPAAVRHSSISSAANPLSRSVGAPRYAGHVLTHVTRACRLSTRPRVHTCESRIDRPSCRSIRYQNNSYKRTFYKGYCPISSKKLCISNRCRSTDIDGLFEATDRAATTSQLLNIEATSNKLLGFNQSVVTQATAANGTRRTLSNVISAINYQLDANGNLVSDGLRSFDYSAENRLEKVQITQNGEAAKISYLHNAQGQRVFKSEPQTAQTLPNEAELGTSFVDWLKKNFQWLYAQAQTNATLGTSYSYGEASLPSWAMLGEYGNGGANSSGRTEYIWLPTDDGSAIPIAMFRSNRYFNIHTDHLGTPRLVKDDQAKPVWQWSYSAFGDNKPTGILRATTNPNSAITNQPVLLNATNPAAVLNFRLPGQYWDSETGLAQNYMREYMSTQGRYTQNDPIGLAGGWNRYSYVAGNPLLLSDPTGLDPWCRDRTLNLNMPAPVGQGGGCGDPNNDKYVPDLFPQACRSHDICYANPGPTRFQCDNEFLRDMYRESRGNTLVTPLTFYIGVRVGGGDAFDAARTRPLPRAQDRR
jgi:RHS repeat-associated protein